MKATPASLSIVVIAVFLASCSMTITRPTENESIGTAAIPVAISANTSWSNLRVELVAPGPITTDITSQFQFVAGQNAAEASLTGYANGAYRLNAQADLYCWYCAGTTWTANVTRNFSINASTTPVAPTLTSIAPTTGPAGTQITLQGTGFANGMTANIGTQTGVATAVTTATTASTTIPNGLTGTVNVSVQIGTQASVTRAFTITVPPAVVQLYRSGDTDIQRIDAANAAAPMLVGAAFAAGLSPGGMGAGTVGCVRTAFGLIRSTTTNIESCPIGATGVIGPNCSSLVVLSSGTATDVAIAGTLVARSTENGIQTFRLNANGSLTQLGSSNNGTLSPTGSAVDFPQVASPSVVVRAHANGIDVFDISAPATPVLAGRVVNAGISSTGVDVKIAGSTRVLRSFSNGLDVYDITNPAAPVRIAAGPLNVGLSSSRASLALFAAGSRAVRATSDGIEVFDIAANPIRLGGVGGDLSSSAGTDVVMDASGHAVRTSDGNVEIYDVTTNQSTPTRIGNVGVNLSATGVCIINR